MTGRTAARTAALLVVAGLVLGGTSACGLRDRAADAGAAPAGATATAQETSRVDLPDQDPAPAEDTAASTTPTAEPVQQPAVTEAQVRAVEAAVGAASKVVSQGEAEVASDG